MTEAAREPNATGEAQPAEADRGETAAEHRHILRRAASLTALLGAGHAVLFLIAMWLLSEVPTSSDSDAAILA